MNHERFEHGPLVEAWLKEPAWLPDTDLERVSRLVHQTPQRRSWLPRPGLERSRIMLSATTMVAGIAAIALTAGVLLNGLTPQTPATDQLPAAAAEATMTMPVEPDVETQEPEVTNAEDDGASEAAISLPSVLPESVVGGSIDTPAGPARWVRIAYPAVYVDRLVPWQDGLASWGVHGEGEDAAWELRSTTDGVRWASVPLPEELASVTSRYSPRVEWAADAVYLISGRESMWRSTDDGRWRSIDTSLLDAIEPKGWGVDEPSLSLRPYAGDLVVQVEYRYGLPRNRLGIQKRTQTAYLHRLGDGRYALCHPNKSSCSAREATQILRIKELDGGLVIRDDRTGVRLGRLDGASAAEIYEGRRATRREVLTLDGDELVRAASPIEWKEESRAAPLAGAPADAPEGAQLRQVGPTWLAVDYEPIEGAPGPEAPDRWWMYLGGTWVDLGELGFPQVRPFETYWSAFGAGNAAAFWFSDGGEMWMVEMPEGA